ncbi:MAG TPA: hypothetical protein VFJ02_02210, partial [Vicinamibacterales bacterium]|nr:hypothetical protein [Vicinamibacterales bacterium]
MAALRTDAERLDRLTPFAWGVIVVVALSVLYALLEVGFVRPYLWPAGAGAVIDGDPAAQFPLKARPPDVRRHFVGAPEITHVARGGPAAANGLDRGDRLVAAERPGYPPWAAVAEPGAARPAQDPGSPLVAWRAWYRLGVSGPIVWRIEPSTGPPDRRVAIERPAVWRSGTDGWARRHLGMILQTIVFISAAVILLLLRSYDLTAGLCVLALAFSGVGGGGPLLGVERGLPVLGNALTMFSWLASPLAFPTIALAILYFPSRSRLLDRYPWLHAVPLLAAVPLILPALATALFLIGIDAMLPLALWDATHPTVYLGAFVCALSINVLAVGEGAYRYRVIHNANERRRIRMA